MVLRGVQVTAGVITITATSPAMAAAGGVGKLAELTEPTVTVSVGLFGVVVHLLKRL